MVARPNKRYRKVSKFYGQLDRINAKINLISTLCLTLPLAAIESAFNVLSKHTGHTQGAGAL